MKFVATLSDNSNIELVPKSVINQWFWIKPDWLTWLHNETIRSNNLTDRGDGTPCVFRTGAMGTATKWNPLWLNPVEMTDRFQYFAADCLALKKYGVKFTELPTAQSWARPFMALPDAVLRILSVLEPFMREYITTKFTSLYSEGLAYCNNVSWGEGDVYWNVIKNENPDAPWPKMFPLVDGTDSYTGEMVGDYVRLDSWTLDTLPTEYDISILDDPRMGWCTIIRPTEIDGGFSVYQFPHLGGLPVPRPFVTREPTYYWLREVEVYDGPRKRLFWPPRDGTP